jgi:hypothetical protein
MPAGPSFALDGTPSGRDPNWAGIRSALLRANREFRDAPFSPATPTEKKSPIKDPPLVGAAYGRVWEVVYYRGTYFSTAPLLNVVTAIRWGDPEKMTLYETPWFYIGGRPRILSRLSPDLQWIIERQRTTERNLRGYQTGDAEFDRRWAFYAYRGRPSEVLQDPARRRWLQGLADLRPTRGSEMPTISSLGTTVALAAVVTESEETARQAGTLVQSLSQLLDAIELSTGNHSASQLPLTMDLLPDGTGYPSPTLRFRCPYCGQETHPRFVPEYHTEMCALCRKGLYTPG